MNTRTQNEVFGPNAFILGTVRHSRTGAHIVFLSLDGEDVTPIAAFTRASDANVAQKQTEEALRRLVEVVESAPDEEAEDAGIAVWVTFLRQMNAVSDAEMTPFSHAQLAVIERGFAALKEQSRAVPDAPEGFSRVLDYSPEALAGIEMPRVRLTPITPATPMPPESLKGK